MPGVGVNRPPPNKTEVKERAKLYLFSLDVPSWQVMEVNYTLYRSSSRNATSS